MNLKQELRQYMRGAKDKPCGDCGVRYPHYVMDFDHRPEEIKRYEVSQMLRERQSLGTLAAEIAKCDVVCANCHRERTHQRKKGGIAGRKAAPEAQMSLA